MAKVMVGKLGRIIVISPLEFIIHNVRERWVSGTRIILWKHSGKPFLYSREHVIYLAKKIMLRLLSKLLSLPSLEKKLQIQIYYYIILAVNRLNASIDDTCGNGFRLL